MVKQLTVIKRDGSRQHFQSRKISKVVKAAGLNSNQTAKLAKTVSLWAASLNKNEVSSLRIRDKVLEQLRLIDPPVARLFQWYQKTKENK